MPIIFVTSPWNCTSYPPEPQLIIDYPQITSWDIVDGYSCELATIQATCTEATLGQIQNNPTYNESVRLVE